MADARIVCAHHQLLEDDGLVVPVASKNHGGLEQTFKDAFVPPWHKNASNKSTGARHLRGSMFDVYYFHVHACKSPCSFRQHRWRSV
jgi:hypothetical protein